MKVRIRWLITADRTAVRSMAPRNQVRVLKVKKKPSLFWSCATSTCDDSRRFSLVFFLLQTPLLWVVEVTRNDLLNLKFEFHGHRPCVATADSLLGVYRPFFFAKQRQLTVRDIYQTLSLSLLNAVLHLLCVALFWNSRIWSFWRWRRRHWCTVSRSVSHWSKNLFYFDSKISQLSLFNTHFSLGFVTIKGAL